jgi:hypothetical protein
VNECGSREEATRYVPSARADQWYRVTVPTTWVTT